MVEFGLSHSIKVQLKIYFEGRISLQKFNQNRFRLIIDSIKVKYFSLCTVIIIILWRTGFKNAIIKVIFANKIHFGLYIWWLMINAILKDNNIDNILKKTYSTSRLTIFTFNKTYNWKLIQANLQIYIIIIIYCYQFMKTHQTIYGNIRTQYTYNNIVEKNHNNIF